MKGCRENGLMGRILLAALALGLLAAPQAVQAQAVDDAAAKNAQQARAALDKMVAALGGPAWLNMKNQMRHGHIAAFYQGRPKHRDVLEFFEGREGWEVTYRGKKAITQDILDDYLRRRDHSIETVIKVWLKDPKTILVYEGQRMAERHLAEQVTLISAENEAVTIQMDVETHLPLRRSFEWRDPVYKDKNLDAEEYADYHVVDGLPTPFSITRLKGDDMYRQYFLDRVEYNRQLPDDFWNVDAASKRIKK